jgi:hypothetical protein
VNVKFVQYSTLDLNINASIIVDMRLFFVLPLCFLLACSPSTLSEWRVEGISIVRDLVEELEQIETLKDLQVRNSSIKKKYNKLVQIMIEAEKYDEEDAVRPGSFFSDALRDQYIRIYRIEGGKEELFDMQKEGLHKLDLYLSKKNA